jgi:hypothetical protein
MHRIVSSSRPLALGLLIAALVFTSARAETGDVGREIDLFASGGFLASPGMSGAAVTSGLRLGIGRHLALSLDLGYGLLAAHSTVQDRWWIIPTAAIVIPAGRLRFDIGGGIGRGAASGYRSWSGYTAKPFDPIWAFQLVPTAQLHATLAIPLTSVLSLILRLEAASLLLLESRAGVSDTTWAALSFGIRLRLF